MIKLDRQKSNKLCAILLTSALLLPIVGCSSQNQQAREDDEKLSYSFVTGHIYITDNETDITVVLPHEY